MAKLNVVLYEPEIPANTGNIGRTCVATGTRLHLIEPLGFHLDEKAIKRAGMDYWSELDVTTYVNWEDFCEILGIEFVNIDKNTTISSFKQQLRNNEIYYMLNKALR